MLLDGAARNRLLLPAYLKLNGRGICAAFHEKNSTHNLMYWGLCEPVKWYVLKALIDKIKPDFIKSTALKVRKLYEELVGFKILTDWKISRRKD